MGGYGYSIHQIGLQATGIDDREGGRMCTSKFTREWVIDTRINGVMSVSCFMSRFCIGMGTKQYVLGPLCRLGQAEEQLQGV
jgi:hypothetical protein